MVKKGFVPWNKGKYLSEDHKEKIRIACSGSKNGFFNKHHTPEAIEIIREKHKRENLSPETIERMKIANSGRKHTTEWKKWNSERMSGSGNPMYGTISPMKGRKGKDHPSYIDGRSVYPYCEKFNSILREQVRSRDSHTCQLCGKTQEQNKRRLHVHHIHYDKQYCYPDLICLCTSCNSKVNKPSERKNYESFFMNKLNDRNLLFWTKYRNK